LLKKDQSLEKSQNRKPDPLTLTPDKQNERIQRWEILNCGDGVRLAILRFLKLLKKDQSLEKSQNRKPDPLTPNKPMNEYIASTYGDHIADAYDELVASYEDAAIDILADLAGGGRALELGIGTGRVALPLSARGIEVHGIDVSSAMVSKLKAKPGGDSLMVTMGNFADVPVDGEFSLVYIVFNTLFALLTQEEQLRCFRNVAAHLAAGATFVIDAFVPDIKRFTGGQVVRTHAVTTDSASLEVSQHDPVSQRVKSQLIVLKNDQIKLYPVELRYCWPSELDLMARLAGLRLRHRWGSWNRGEFTSASEKHISVYERQG
jgi:SAM-dependent methyltransferase